MNQTNRIDKMYLMNDGDGDVTGRHSEMESAYLAKVQYQSNQDLADVDDEGNVPDQSANGQQRAGVPPIQKSGKTASSEKLKRKVGSRFETDEDDNEGIDLGKQWVFDDEFEKLRDRKYNGIKLEDRSNFETDMSNWAPIPSPAAKHGADHRFDKLL